MGGKNGDIVYIRFEYGDGSKGVWEYDGWGEKEIGDMVDDGDSMGIVRGNGNRMWLNDKDG